MDLSILFSAKHFAVVGASANEHKVGHQIVSALCTNPTLTIYPINLKGGTILNIPVYAHLWQTPSPAEIVIVAVPVPAVESVIDECISVRAKAIVLITSGFAEEGESGLALQTRILTKLRASGIALLGPNTMGYISPPRQIYASFGPSNIAQGPIALISQSGAMLSALFEEYNSGGTGVSFALSLGNNTGINENDALSYALSDPSTKVIAIYLESLSDPKELLDLAKRLSPHKPIFLLKGGITEEGRSAAVSHTAALATSQVLLNDLCLQAGIVQVANFEQLVRASIACAKTQYLPENLLIVTNAGGPSVVLTDEITELAIPLIKLDAATRAALVQAFPTLKIHNPLDLLGDATPSDYQKALSILSRDISIDVIVVLITEQAVTDLKELSRVLSRHWGKHLLFACLAGGDHMEPFRQQLKQAGVIVTRYPNEIADTLGSLLQAKKQLGKKVERAVIREESHATYPSTYVGLVNLLNKFGISSPPQLLVSAPADLNKLKDLGWPVIAKTTNLTLLHKAKLGAVIKDIVSLTQAKQSIAKLQKWGSEVVFQQKIAEGVEVLLGAHHDSIWGWYLAVGLGGSLSDTYDDRAYIFLPVTSSEMDLALGRTKLSDLLSKQSRIHLISAMSNLQTCVFSTPGLLELEINPLFVSENGVVAADLKRS